MFRAAAPSDAVSFFSISKRRSSLIQPVTTIKKISSPTQQVRSAPLEKSLKLIRSENRFFSGALTTPFSNTCTNDSNRFLRHQIEWKAEEVVTAHFKNLSEPEKNSYQPRNA